MLHTPSCKPVADLAGLGGGFGPQAVIDRQGDGLAVAGPRPMVSQHGQGHAIGATGNGNSDAGSRLEGAESLKERRKFFG